MLNHGEENFLLKSPCDALEGAGAECDAFLGRFQAVAEAETLALTGSAGSDLSALVEQSLKAVGPERCKVTAGQQFASPISVQIHRSPGRANRSAPAD